MSIEFRCIQCRKLLRTPDESFGKRARCPECDTVQTVGGEVADPHSSFTASPSRESFAAAPAAGETNPYQSPGDEATIYPDAVGSAAAIRPTPVDIGDLLTVTWRVFKDNLGECLLVSFVTLVIYYAAFGVIFLLINLFLLNPAGKLGPDLRIQISNGLASLIMTPISLFLFCGEQIYMLRIARGQPVSLRYLFSGGRWFARLLGAGLLFGFAYLIGSLVIVGGVILLCFLWPFPFLIFDRDLGAIESLTTAAQITEGNRLTAFLTGLLMIALFPLTLFCGCGIGAMAQLVFLQVLPAVFYLMMTGQPIGRRWNE